jgi:hypothetical protein
VTLLPLSAGGAWVDYVYGLVSLDVVSADAAETAKAAPKKAKPAEPVADESAEPVEAQPAEAPVAEEAAEEPVVEEAEEPTGPQTAAEAVAEQADEAAADPAPAEPAEELEQPVPLDLPEETAAAPDDAEIAPAEADWEAPPAEAAEHGGEEEPIDETEDAPARNRPGFSKLLDNLVGLTGFYGHGYKVDPTIPGAPDDQAPMDATDEPAPATVEEPPAETAAAPEPAAEPENEPVAALGQEPEPAAEPAAEQASDEPAAEPAEPAAYQSAPSVEGSLQTKLADVRAKADEARQAKLKANVALYEGLSAAYDFALDAEEAPEDYLRLVEAEGLKIQLRSPMRPVVKLAFNGMCDEATIRQLEAVLAWALDNELPRGSLAEQIEAAGGIGPILTGDAPSS